MKTVINTKGLESITINNVVQVSITHTGNKMVDDDYNTLQIVYTKDNRKLKKVFRLSEISTSYTLVGVK